ncbi:REP-associated tyrosine transposase [Rubellicoccus peritrichatus]|uniref:Transposase n=1 Tax=Rubellicoccus peritrichatus TaxID=3080537 RepID=A0AAQ3QW92_9BACT|nr:transposase [Puniceicoccus sp. CR14]WOO41657.1 transposase [Puniceicoccus sp. CR14]
MQQAKRKNLYHTVPDWVKDGSYFFITINCQVRSRAQLTRPDTATALFKSIAKLHANHTWWCHLCLLMPDHLHALIAFAPHETMKDCIARYKSYQARKSGIVWQDGFFDHRIRNDVAFLEKASYIRQNPVRAGLCKTSGDWPYIWPNTSKEEAH